LSVVHVLHFLSLVGVLPICGSEDEIIRLVLAEPLAPRPRSDVVRGFAVNLTELGNQEIVHLEFGPFLRLNFVYFFSVVSACDFSGFFLGVVDLRGLGCLGYRERLCFTFSWSSCLVV